MDILDSVMLAGLCLAVGACAFLLAAQLKAARQAGRGDIRLENVWRMERLDLYMGALWSGLLLVQTTNILHHMQPDGTIKLSLLSLAAFAGCVLICGVFAGRLLLRRELRRGKEHTAQA